MPGPLLNIVMNPEKGDFMRNEPECYSVNEICRNYNISQSTVYQMIRQKKIRAYKLGRCWKIPKEDFLRVLYEHS